ncbi:MAG: hypothetical protein IT181_05120 [Acidobacteria bacterium]|nr:hypothetical protein [Acidobacteriota bacterium]
MADRMTTALSGYSSDLEDLLDRLAGLEASVSQLTLDRAELRTTCVLLKKRLDVLERRLNTPKMPL